MARFPARCSASWAGSSSTSSPSDTLGVTSLVLTLAGFWAGRYGETTGRDQRFAPLVAVGAITVLAGAFGYVLHYMLDDEVVAKARARHLARADLRPEPRSSPSPCTRSSGALVGEGVACRAVAEVEVVV